MTEIRKAIFPVAGLGTRFLPATKANPKEMLPIVDKPLIQYAVEEAIAAGITQLIFVTSSTKIAIENHFDGNYELEKRLEESQKLHLLDMLRSIRPPGISCVYVRQPEPRGLGNAVLCAREVVGNEPFAVLLADDLIDAPSGVLTQMLNVYRQTPSNIVAVEQVRPEDTDKYGIVDVHKQSNGLSLVRTIVEKPKPEQAPSCLGVAGRYILSPEIFEILKKTPAGLGGEVQLTDAMAQLKLQQELYAFEFEGKRFDCGSKLGYLQACVMYGLKHPELAEPFYEFVQGLSDQKSDLKRSVGF